MYAQSLGEQQAVYLPDGGVTFIPVVKPLPDIQSKGRGEWMVPIAIGIIAAYFIFYRGGRRRDW